MRNLVFALMVIIAVVSLPCGAYASNKREKKNKGKSSEIIKEVSAYDKLLKNKNVITKEGKFITLHKAGNKLYFEIPVKYMNRELLLASTATNMTSPEFCDLGYKANDPLHLKFTKRDSSVFLHCIFVNCNDR